MIQSAKAIDEKPRRRTAGNRYTRSTSAPPKNPACRSATPACSQPHLTRNQTLVPILLDCPDEINQKMFDNQIISIGGLKQYLVQISAAGNSAVESLAAYEATQEEIDQFRQQFRGAGGGQGGAGGGQGDGQGDGGGPRGQVGGGRGGAGQTQP